MDVNWEMIQSATTEKQWLSSKTKHIIVATNNKDMIVNWEMIQSATTEKNNDSAVRQST